MIFIKKVLVILLSLIVIFCGGCNNASKTNSDSDSDSNYKAPPNIAKPYSFETAIKNGDVVKDIKGKEYNIEKLQTFIENVKRGAKDKVRIMTYTSENVAIQTDLVFDDKKINYSKDTTKNSAGVRSLETGIFDSIYKNSTGYYLKSIYQDISIY